MKRFYQIVFIWILYLNTVLNTMYLLKQLTTVFLIYEAMPYFSDNFP